MRRNPAAELYRRNRLLAVGGWLLAVLLMAALVGLATDDRTVMGANAWAKPAKYIFSLTLFVWTIAWFSRYLARRRRPLRLLSIIIAIATLVVAVLLLLQAARGTVSHYNMATDFDAAVYRTIATAIGVDAFMVLWLLFLFGRPDPRPDTVYLWGIRLGIVSFLFGAVVGSAMIANNAHTIGWPNGGPGLPFLDWSTVAGDLRIAHLMGVHGLQLLPLAGYTIGRWRALPYISMRILVLAAVAALYAAALAAVFLQALAGEPLI